MLKFGVDPDEVKHMTMIDGYSKNGRAYEARQLFDKMIENSIRPSSYSYTARTYKWVSEEKHDR
jgi:pentatricopeptide repeat protein